MIGVIKNDKWTTYQITVYGRPVGSIIDSFWEREQADDIAAWLDRTMPDIIEAIALTEDNNDESPTNAK